MPASGLNPRRYALALSLVGLLLLAEFAPKAFAADVQGLVTYRGQPVPGVSVTATRAPVSVSTLTNVDGVFRFAGLDQGRWMLNIEMRGFAPIHADIAIASAVPPFRFTLTMLNLKQVLSGLQPVQQAQSVAIEAPDPIAPVREDRDPFSDTAQQTPSTELDDLAADGLLVNGSQNNAATSIYSLAPAFGNRRPQSHALYNGSFGLLEGNSLLNAQPYSLTGLNTPTDNYNQTELLASIGGPMRIPYLLRQGPTFFLAYQWSRSSSANALSGRVPTLAERSGDLTGLLDSTGNPLRVYNPANGQPFTASIPVTPQAAALLALIPTPNLPGNSRYNFQRSVLSSIHADALQSRLYQSAPRHDTFSGGFSFKSQRSAGVNLFDFVDATSLLGLDVNVNWSHRFGARTFLALGHHFTRQRVNVRPAFAGLSNISALAGIGGNNQDPLNWGPPALDFSSGFADLRDVDSSSNRDRTDATSLSLADAHGRHHFTLGADFRRQEFNEFGQQNPRGIFSFTGAATSNGDPNAGSDLADFLLGIPDASALAYGNPDKYFRQSVYDLYANDDWRMKPNLSLNAGLRWDYAAPPTELKNRLVNLDISPDFSRAAPVLAADRVGPLTGIHYPSSLIRPDRLGLQPRVGFAWRPRPASSFVVRAGYGLYDDTSIYIAATRSMSQQAPLSISRSIQNAPACPITLANGFPAACNNAIPDTFAIDPHLRVGYAQNWNLAVQSDLPASLVLSLAYMGTKGTHGMQEILPNSFPLGIPDPCPACDAGYIYRTSDGNSSRHAAQLQLRRRLRSGITAAADYTFAKAIDDDAQLGGESHQLANASAQPAIAQDWRNPRAERSLSSFDQRHLLHVRIQYTTGMGLGGGTLMSGWRGRLFKQWTTSADLKAGTGLPQNPIYAVTVPGTALSGVMRPDRTALSIDHVAPGYHLNPAAYAAPPPGSWGNAPRNSIRGPAIFAFDTALGRTFTLHDQLSLDLRVDAANVLNHVTFSAWNSVTNSTTFGLPVSANPMRSLQITARVRF